MKENSSQGKSIMPEREGRAYLEVLEKVPDAYVSCALFLMR
jgi:hypothetical protein